MARYGRLLTEAQWEKIRPLLPKQPKRPRGGRPRADDRKVLEGILWILRSGARWQDLPEEFPHPSTCCRRRQDLSELLDRLNLTIEELTAAIEQEAKKRPEVLRLMTHPGVGPITALAFVLIIGAPERFHCGKQIGSYVGLIPCEDSSAGQQRLGHISKQGNTLLRFLLLEAAQTAVRWDPDWRRRFLHLAMRQERRIAKVAMARKLAVRLYWMWRKGWDYQQTLEFGSHAGQPVHVHGVK